MEVILRTIIASLRALVSFKVSITIFNTRYFIQLFALTIILCQVVIIFAHYALEFIVLIDIIFFTIFYVSFFFGSRVGLAGMLLIHIISGFTNITFFGQTWFFHHYTNPFTIWNKILYFNTLLLLFKIFIIHISLFTFFAFLIIIIWYTIIYKFFNFFTQFILI